MMKNIFCRRILIYSAQIFFAFAMFCPWHALAEEDSSVDVFRKGLNVKNIFVPKPESKKEIPKQEEVKVEAAKIKEPEFVSDDPTSHIVPPDEDPQVRINPEAPGPFKAMAASYQAGDTQTAAKYAGQYVRYMVNVMYQVRALTRMIGEAMVREGLLKEDNWVGVEQYMDIEMAHARAQDANAIKATHEESMKRVSADPKGQAEVFFFFSLTSNYAREMASDVERLWRLSQRDRNIQVTAMAIGVDEKQSDWLKEFADYTGMTMPIRDGTEAAKAFRVGFVPAVVVIAPNSGKVYVKTGQQDFERLYDFVRHVQGKSGEITPEVRQVMEMEVGATKKNIGKDARVVRANFSTEVAEAGARF